jgi:hypothetical protein
MLIRLLQALALLVEMKNGGEPNDISRMLKYAHLAARAGDKGKQHLQAAVAKVEQLVREDRGLTELELRDLDNAIRGKLARAAAVVLPPEEPPADPPAPPAAEPDAPAASDTPVSFPSS